MVMSRLSAVEKQNDELKAENARLEALLDCRCPAAEELAPPFRSTGVEIHSVFFQLELEDVDDDFTQRSLIQLLTPGLTCQLPGFELTVAVERMEHLPRYAPSTALTTNS